MKLLLKHGADPKLKNRDNATPLDLAKDQEIADLLRGKSQLFIMISQLMAKLLKKLSTKVKSNSYNNFFHVLM